MVNYRKELVDQKFQLEQNPAIQGSEAALARPVFLDSVVCPEGPGPFVQDQSLEGLHVLEGFIDSSEERRENPSLSHWRGFQQATDTSSIEIPVK